MIRPRTARSVTNSVIGPLAFAALVATGASAQSAPHASDIDRVRIREAYRLAGQLGDRVWPGWHDAPFALLLDRTRPEWKRDFLTHRFRLPDPR